LGNPGETAALWVLKSGEAGAEGRARSRRPAPGMTMARGKRQRYSDESGDPGEFTIDESGLDDEPLGLETQVQAAAIVDELLRATDEKDPRWGALFLLRHQLRVDEHQMQEARQAIAELQQAYDKLTSPANRLGTFLDAPEDGIARVAVGDTEYYANVDPQKVPETPVPGACVRLNDAFAVVGDLGPWTNGPLTKVAEALPDGRLRIGTEPGGLGSRIVVRSSALDAVQLRQGDEVRLDPSGRVAVEHFHRAETRDYFFEEVPETPWSVVGGQEDAIRLIRDTIELPLLHPELYERFHKRPIKGILLYGPPGCGKTLIGRATAYNLTREYRQRFGRDIKECFMYISGPRILNMWLGESERMVREIFAAARERAAEGHLVFVFIDEAESLLRTRSAGRTLNIANTLVPQFSAEMDGMVSLRNVVVILTSNRPDYIDPAILRPERIDRKIKIGRPDRSAARDIFRIYLDDRVPMGEELVAEHGGDAAAREHLYDQCVQRIFRSARETEFLEVHLLSGRTDVLHWRDLVSGALIMSVVERAKDLAIRRAIEKGNPVEGMQWTDLEQAIDLEFRENEIFPKSDVVEDWLKLIDYEPENVVTVKPIRPEKGRGRAVRRTVI